MFLAHFQHAWNLTRTMSRIFKCDQYIKWGTILQCRCHQLPNWKLLFFHFSSLRYLNKCVKKPRLMKTPTFACVSSHIKICHLPSNCFFKNNFFFKFIFTVESPQTLGNVALHIWCLADQQSGKLSFILCTILLQIMSQEISAEQSLPHRC